MRLITRRSMLRSSAGLIAAGAVARPYIANAAATTATAWWTQGFIQSEDTSFKKLAGDYEKASGNKLDYSIIPFAPLRQKAVAAVTSGAVPDVMEVADYFFGALHSWDDKLLDVTDVVETQKSEFLDVALSTMHNYNRVPKKRSFYGVPMKAIDPLSGKIAVTTAINGSKPAAAVTPEESLLEAIHAGKAALRHPSR